MGVESSSYELTVKMPPDNVADFDMEYFMFQLLKQVPNAKIYLTDEGKATGNGGDWDTILEDFSAFSKKHPDVLFVIEEEIEYGEHYENHYYVQNGKSKTITPVKTWPEFSPEDMETI